MIHVDRARVPSPASLAADDPQSPGAKETAAAKNFYKKAANRDASFKTYKAFKNPEVVRTLQTLFHHKCAYCESPYGATQPTDVEHWRPKGEVEDPSGKAIRPGYYWLAATWENLLPSCCDCNRRRYHDVNAPDGKPVLLGKQNAFPLQPGSPRARKPGHEKKERPLLLNPCEDHPETYLDFTPWEPGQNDAERGVIRIKPRISRERRARAEASIRYYALNRGGLVQQRKPRLIEILAQIERVEEAAERVHAAPSSAIRNREHSVYDREMNRLLAFQEPDQPYSLMARQLIGQFLHQRM